MPVSIERPWRRAFEEVGGTRPSSVSSAITVSIATREVMQIREGGHPRSTTLDRCTGVT
jgi:hypothetical protein